MFADGLKFAHTDGMGNIKTYSVYINGSHVCINERGRTVFQREGLKVNVPTSGSWYDAPHKEIVDAIAHLERALRAVV